MTYHGSSFNLTQLPRNALFAWATAAANRVSEKAGVPGRWSFTRKWRDAVNIFHQELWGFHHENGGYEWDMHDIYIMEIKHQSSTQIWIYHAENLHISGYALVNGDFAAYQPWREGGLGANGSRGATRNARGVVTLANKARNDSDIKWDIYMYIYYLNFKKPARPILWQKPMPTL